jgi:hypothetical protein
MMIISVLGEELNPCIGVMSTVHHRVQLELKRRDTGQPRQILLTTETRQPRQRQRKRHHPSLLASELESKVSPEAIGSMLSGALKGPGAVAMMPPLDPAAVATALGVIGMPSGLLRGDSFTIEGARSCGIGGAQFSGKRTVRIGEILEEQGAMV